MIGLIYFSFLLLFSQCISGNGVHLISSWWVINPGRINLQILPDNWVQYTHVSSPTGYIFFTTVPVWVPAMHLGTPAARKTVWNSYASAYWPKTILIQQRPQFTAVLGILSLDRAPHSCYESVTISSSLGQWRTDKLAFQKIQNLYISMDCGKGEKSGCGLCHMACKLETLSGQLHGEKATKMLQYNHLLSGSCSHKAV